MMKYSATWKRKEFPTEIVEEKRRQVLFSHTCEPSKHQNVEGFIFFKFKNACIHSAISALLDLHDYYQLWQHC